MSFLNNSSLVEKLDAFIRKYYKNLLLRGFIYSLTLLLVFYLGITVTEYFAHFDIVIRTMLFYSFVFIALAILIIYIIIPFSKLYRFGKIISYEEAALIIGKHFTNVQDKLLNVLQLQEVGLQVSNLENTLLEASINQKVKELKPIPFIAAIDLSENKKYLKFLFVPLAIILIIVIIAPRILTIGTERLVQHSQYFEIESPFQFLITNDKLETPTQQDFQLNVKIDGSEVPNTIYAVIDGNEFKLEKKSISEFSYLFKNVQKNIPFHFLADGFSSQKYELIALPNPVLLDFDITLNYPSYLNKKEEIIKNTGDLLIPAGTKVKWNFNTKNTESIRLIFSDTTANLPPLSANQFLFSQRFLSDNNYSIVTSNSLMKSKDSVKYTINVIPDDYPQIAVEEKKDTFSSKLIYFSGDIRDDYGFNKLNFNYRFIINNDSNKTDKFKSLTTNASPIDFNKAVTQTRFFYQWDINKLGITPGDQIEYYFEVWDNDGVNGSKSTRSQKMIFKAPTLAELAEKTEKNNSKIKDDLEESIRQAKEVQKELSDLQKKVAEKKELSWEEKKKLQELLNKQSDLQKKVDDIKNENLKNNQQQNEYKQQDEKILEKQKQLEELFDKVMTPELKKKYEELQKLMEKMDKDKVQEALEKLKLDNKDLMKELDRNLEVFKQLELEQKLQQNIDKLNDLAKKQEDLAKKSEDKNSDSKEQKAKQDELNKEFKELQKDIKEMEKKNSELEQPKAMEKTEEQQKQIESEMQNSSEQLNNNQKKSASKSQKSAAQKMQQMSNQMAKAQQEMDKEQSEEDINKLRDLLNNLIKLSFDQEALIGELDKAKTNSPYFFKLNQKQKKLQDDSKMIEDSLFALSKRVPAIKAAVNKEISAINLNMEKAVEEIKESQTPSFDGRNHKSEAMSRQQFAMTSINNLALMLNEALSQMQQQQQQKGKPGSGSCSKPGGTGQKKSMSSIRKMQEQLNQQIQKLKDGMDKNGNKPGEKMGSSAGMSQELVKLAAQQEALRKELQKMSDQLGKEEGGSGAGGIKKMIEKMEETETDLVNKLLSNETMKRQQEILTRLLESEKAEKEREMDEKRQSNEAKNENLSNPSQFLTYKRQREKEIELLKTVPPSLNSFYKGKVNAYFNQLEY